MKPLLTRPLLIFVGLAAGVQAASDPAPSPASSTKSESRSEARSEGGTASASGSAAASGSESPSSGSRPSGEAGSSVRSSAITHTSADGRTITTITTERDGNKTTRTIIVGKDGAVEVSDPVPGESGPEAAGTDGPHPPGTPAPASGWLGVHSVPVSEVLRSQLDLAENQGVVLEFVAADGPAAAAGLRANDLVLTLDGASVAGVSAFRARLAQTKPGQQVSLGFLRKGQASTASVTLGERPADADPGPKVGGEAGRLIKESIEKVHQIRRGVVVDGTGKTHVIENGDPFEILLNDPNVPEEMKGHLRESRKLMKRTLPDERAEETDNPRETGAPE